MIPAGPAVERGIAIALAVVGGSALCWLQTRVDWLENVTAERVQSVHAIEVLNASTGGELAAAGEFGEPFPGHVVQWLDTPAGRRLVVRPMADREPQR